MDRLIAEKRAQERQIDELKTRFAQSAVRDLESKAKEKNGVKYLITQVDGSRPRSRCALSPMPCAINGNRP